DLRRLLTGGDPATLARAYPGPLLARSESPEIRRERDELEVLVRTSLLQRGAPEDLWTYAQTINGREDFQLLERLTSSLPQADPRAAAARARLRAPRPSPPPPPPPHTGTLMIHTPRTHTGERRSDRSSNRPTPAQTTRTEPPKNSPRHPASAPRAGRQVGGPSAPRPRTVSSGPRHQPGGRSSC